MGCGSLWTPRGSPAGRGRGPYGDDGRSSRGAASVVVAIPFAPRRQRERVLWLAAKQVGRRF